MKVASFVSNIPTMGEQYRPFKIWLIAETPSNNGQSAS